MRIHSKSALRRRYRTSVLGSTPALVAVFGTLSLCVATAWTTSSPAQPADADRVSSRAHPMAVRITADSLLSGDSTASILENWMFREGDDPSWAEPDFDDSDWRTQATTFRPSDRVFQEWSGIAWFRVRLDVDSSIADQPLGFRIRIIGAAEIYLDGRLVHSAGKVGNGPEVEEIVRADYGRVISLPVAGPSPHLVAVRYSNYWLARHRWKGGQPGFVSRRGVGFQIAVGNLNQMVRFSEERMLSVKAKQVFFAAVPLTFAVLHFMLFLFYPGFKPNLYYSVFALSMAAVTYLPLEGAMPHSIGATMAVLALFRISLITLAIFGLKFIYSVYYERMPRRFWFFFFAGLVLLLSSGVTTIYLVYGFMILYLLEKLRVILKAVLERRHGARILMVGAIVMGITASIQMLGDARILRFVDVEVSYHMYGFLAFTIAISVILARHIVRTNLKLQRQLIQVKELSDKTIDQARRAKEQEMAQKLLEAELEHKAKELEEAKKLEKALSDLEETNLTLKETQSQLVQSEKMASLGMLVAGVAHEINTPVGAISSMYDTSNRGLEKLKDALGTEFPAEYKKSRKITGALEIIDEAHRVIKTGSERVSNIVSRLRSFARLDEAELKEADLHEGLEDTLTMLHHELKQNIEVERKYGELPPVFCYPSQLNQVFLNLLINARQAIGDRKGTIGIETYVEGNWAVIVISDDGMGIEPENLSKLFDPGFTTKGVGVGTGLGLSICYQIVSAHKGQILVESEPGKGTNFKVRIPLNLQTQLRSSSE